jgi:hypothetical protein
MCDLATTQNPLQPRNLSIEKKAQCHAHLSTCQLKHGSIAAITQEIANYPLQFVHFPPRMILVSLGS